MFPQQRLRSEKFDDDDDDDDNNNNNNNNRLCQHSDETIDHIISACPILTKEQYIKRHDRVCAQLNFNICKETGVQLAKKHWYEHVPKSVETGQGGNVTILWNQQVQTDRTIPNNKPDIIIGDSEKRTCMLTLRRLMSYIYGAPILDVSRSHTTTQHSR